MELNQQLEKLNNPELSIDEKYNVLNWIAENTNDVDIAKLIENGVVQNIHFESALLFDIYNFDYRFYEMVYQLFTTKLKNNDTADKFSINQIEQMIDFAISYVRNHTQDELKKYLKSKIPNVDEFDLAEYINLLETFMNKIVLNCQQKFMSMNSKKELLMKWQYLFHLDYWKKMVRVMMIAIVEF